MRRWLPFIFLFCLSLSAQAQPERPALGINLAGIADWSTQHPFVDIFKTARPWIAQRQGAAWGEGGVLALTPEGWVARLDDGQYAETLMFSADPALNAGMDGRYVVLYDGTGTLEFSGASIVNQTESRLELEARPSQGPVFLRLMATDPDDPLRNIRFLLAGSESTYQEQPFNPLFLERLAPFSALRFMDWMATNDSAITAWAERPQPSDASYALRGVPVEVMVQLANTLQADAWFTMPHLADDDYVRQFAAYVRDHLDETLRAYVEYSNETWNGQFQQAQYVSEQGLALGLAPGDPFWSGLRFHSQRAVQVFGLWEEAFGGSERLVRVLASQAANAWTAEQIADFEGAAQQADAIAIAPYFSCDDSYDPQVAALDVAGLLDRQMENVEAGGCAYEYITANLEIARRYGLALIAYEGGQHLANSGDEALSERFIAANREPRMGEIYLAHLRAWRELGGGLFMAFADIGQPSRFGSWGVLESLTQDPATAPKYQALLAFANELGE